jgi:hypothetical protein
MMCAPLCINNRPVAVVPVAPSRRRRPSRKSAALGANDEAMVRKGRCSVVSLAALKPRLRSFLSYMSVRLDTSWRLA